LFPSGFAANLGLLATLGGPDCTIVSDELNHASIIDGCRLSRSPVEIARHNDVDDVESLLRGSDTPRAIVVVDSVFSMDGDEAPVVDLAEVCAHHDALLVVDDAHAVFVGDGPPEVDGLQLLRVVTQSKTLGSVGGAVCGPRPVLDLLVNRARPQIFSTGTPPADAAAALAAIRLVRSSEGIELVERVRKLTDRFVPGHPSPIVPLIVGSEDDAMSAADALLERGLLVPAIRPPTVAAGTSRLRIALSAAHTDEQVDRLERALVDLGLTAPGTPG
jgi:7-keto-8-aminopelargonate synthetase-like enzyme